MKIMATRCENLLCFAISDKYIYVKGFIFLVVHALNRKIDKNTTHTKKSNSTTFTFFFLAWILKSFHVWGQGGEFLAILTYQYHDVF